jgi:hypothetical protein
VFPQSTDAPDVSSMIAHLYRRGDMAVRVTRSAGMLLLSVWLILTGLGGLVALPLPGVVMAVLALIAGVLILVGR